jgi:hypothetical protein
MTLLEKLRGLFSREEVPDEAKALFAKARTHTDLLKGLDELITRNEMEAKEINEEIVKVEETGREEEEKIREGSLPERQRRSTLLHIKRLRTQMDLYESRLRIYERNMDLLQRLMGKIQQMEAMKLSGIDEAKIDEIALAFDEKREKYEDLIASSQAHEVGKVGLSAREDRELSQLEAEILGVSKKTEPSALEKAPPAREKEPAATVAEPAPRALPPRRPIDDEIDREIARIEEESAREEAAAGRRRKAELE